ISRLSSITNSAGYQINLKYGSNVVSAATFRDWLRPITATGINNAVEYCDPAVAGCTLIGDWPVVSYTTPPTGFSRFSAVEDAEGRITQYTYATAGIESVRYPGASSDSIKYNRNAAWKISSV